MPAGGGLPEHEENRAAVGAFLCTFLALEGARHLTVSSQAPFPARAAYFYLTRGHFFRMPLKQNPRQKDRGFVGSLKRKTRFLASFMFNSMAYSQ